MNVQFADGSTKTPEYLAINPNGRIPAIQDGDFTLYESMAINLYLARKHPGPLTPATLEDEARAWQWSFWVMTEVEKPLVFVLLQRLQLPPGSAGREVLPPARADGREEGEPKRSPSCPKPFARARSRARQDASGSGGDRFTVTDLNVASVMSWTRLANVDLSADAADRGVARPVHVAPGVRRRARRRALQRRSGQRSGAMTAKKAVAKKTGAKRAVAKKAVAKKSSKKTVARGVTHQWVRDTALALPGVEEGTSYGTPAFRVHKGFVCRFHQDGESLVVPLDMDDREILMRADPESFYITDHYRNYPYVLARLATVDRDALRDLLEDAWKRQRAESV